MVDQCLQKQNDEHAHKCSCSEEYLVWKPELVKKPEVIYAGTNIRDMTVAALTTKILFKYLNKI